MISDAKVKRINNDCVMKMFNEGMMTVQNVSS